MMSSKVEKWQNRDVCGTALSSGDLSMDIYNRLKSPSFIVNSEYLTKARKIV